MDNNTMEYRINLEKQNKRNDQVTELILDNCRASQISGLTEEFVNLESLSIINVGLVTLKGFPKLPKLKRLELSDNRLTGGLNLLHASSKLQHLNLSGNRIKDLEALEPLKEFHELVNLDLYNCEVTKLEDYRKKVFDLLPNLNSLDGYDRNEREVADSDDSSEEGSEADNRISRDDLDDEEEDEADFDEEIRDYDEEEIDGENDDIDDDDDEDDDDDDDDDDEDDDEEGDLDDDDVYGSEGEVEEITDRGGTIARAKDSANEDDSIQNAEANANGRPRGENPDTNNTANSEDAENGEDDDDDDDEAGDEEADGSDLKQLQRDIGEDEDSDDDDFEPSHEVDDRDHEIDPEDDADDEEASSCAELSTSNLAVITDAGEDVDETKSRGQKRKHEDEGGDEVEDS